MAKLKHEVWIDREGLPGLCLADERGNGFRKLLEEEGGSKIIKIIYAESHFEAMTLYYRFLGRPEFQSEFDEDRMPYSNLS